MNVSAEDHLYSGLMTDNIAFNLAAALLLGFVMRRQRMAVMLNSLDTFQCVRCISKATRSGFIQLSNYSGRCWSMCVCVDLTFGRICLSQHMTRISFRPHAKTSRGKCLADGRRTDFAYAFIRMSFKNVLIYSKGFNSRQPSNPRMWCDVCSKSMANNCFARCTMHNIK